MERIFNKDSKNVRDVCKLQLYLDILNIYPNIYIASLLKLNTNSKN